MRGVVSSMYQRSAKYGSEPLTAPAAAATIGTSSESAAGPSGISMKVLGSPLAEKMMSSSLATAVPGTTSVTVSGTRMSYAGIAGSVIASRVSDITCTPATSAMRCSYATASQPAHSARSEARARARFSFNRSSMNRAPLPTSVWSTHVSLERATSTRSGEPSSSWSM